MSRRGKGKKVDMKPMPFFFNGIMVPRTLLLNILEDVDKINGFESKKYRQLRGQVLNDPIGVGRFLVKRGYIVNAFKMEAKINQGEIPHVIVRCPINNFVEFERIVNEDWSAENEVGNMLA